MGGGLADHEPAAAGTEGSEFSHVSEYAVGEAASSHASPSATCTPDLVSHHKMPHPPATPLSQEYGQPLPPSSYPTMGGGLVDHELAADRIARNEPWTKRDFDMFTFRSRAHAEASQRSGVHTRFPDDGVDQASVPAVS